MKDFFTRLRQHTQARIGQKRRGNSISISELLEFRSAHAMARDAVHSKWNSSTTRDDLEKLGQPSIQVTSLVHERFEYLKRPDLGRVLSDESRAYLKTLCGDSASYDVAWIISDGLSATAVEKHVLPLWKAIQKHPFLSSLSKPPLVLAPLSRVAIGDEIGFLLHARATILLIGERPGLSSEDSLGVYLTYDPQPGNQDSQRNCISNIRPPAGLEYEAATLQLGEILQTCLQRRASGIALKTQSGVALGE